jgi:hypothetical protein
MVASPQPSARATRLAAAEAARPFEEEGDEEDFKDSSTDDEDIQKPEWEPVDTDIYGAGICTIVKDSYYLEMSTEHPFTRTARVVLSFLLLAFMICLQLFLVQQVMQLVTSRAVFDIRDAYADFEKVMYEPSGAFNESNFEKVTNEQKDTICAIPFSQPLFFGAVLLIWSMSVMADLRRVFHIFCQIVLGFDTVSKAELMIKLDKDGLPFGIIAATKIVKLYVAILMISRAIVDCALLWLGSRWLAATPDFGELLMNAVALEFLLFLKDLFFRVVVSKRIQVETENLRVKAKKIHFTPDQFKNPCFLVVGFGWAFCYMYYFQQVLPNYKWDVHDLCVEYLARTSVLSGVATTAAPLTTLLNATAPIAT